MQIHSFRVALAGCTAALLTVGLVACGGEGDGGGAGEGAMKGATATAMITGQGGSKLSGKATFTQTDAGTKIVVDITDAPPGKHGIHLHEHGACSDSPDFTATGGHFNPDGVDHGLPPAEPRHAGDLGNIEVKADGTGHLEITSKVLTVDDGKYGVLGRALIIHEKEDDGGQPTGNAGGRIACADIAKP